MIFLPSNELGTFREYQKIHTYLTLSSIGCPVFKSVLIENNQLSSKDIADIVQYLGSEHCTIRYQYTKPNIQPVRGGNKILLRYDVLMEKMVSDTLLWLLEPIDRLKNNYGINIQCNRYNKTLTFECVGKGFDVSDINRGDITPHQTISFDIPIVYGWYNEWWKFAKFQFPSDGDFNSSKDARLKKLAKLGLSANSDIFSNTYNPLTMLQVEKLMAYSELIISSLTDENEFVVSCSIDENNKFVFWDIQTPAEKMKILGAKQSCQN
jgi:hypothetical protein